MYKCLIIDDEELARKLIVNHINQLDDFEIVACCNSALDASKILKEEHIDLMFLDIEMPLLKGTEFYKNLIQKPSVIFTTAYRDYAVDGFDLNAVDYLLKPITFARFFRAIQRFLALHSTLSDDSESDVSQNTYVFIRENRKEVKVVFDDILYIESVKDYIKIILPNKYHLVKSSMTAFMKQLDSRFLRVHRSYVVNKDKITAFTKHDIEINELEIPIGESYKSIVDHLK